MSVNVEPTVKLETKDGNRDPLPVTQWVITPLRDEFGRNYIPAVC
jgi:hypothetical protein